MEQIITDLTERVILVAVSTAGEEETLDSLDELEQLAKTAGAVTVGKIWQNRTSPDPATYVGSGKLAEITELAWETDATGIICDDELSPAQMRNLSKEMELKVMDRTLLILDIFAARASTHEGRLQVELAQLQHRMTMLTGLGRSLSRLGGGIGTRGPGEKKLETDRRRIRSRITHLKAELSDVRRHRDLLRNGRKGKGLPVAALVGYTNAGKSSLLNALTDADVLQEDKLFATLDPTTRLLTLPRGQQILLTDTVGFIRKLPHHLVEAFKSTLEEACYADLILHVADASNPQVDKQMYVVYDTLRQLSIKGKPILTLWNKIDLVSDSLPARDLKSDGSVYTSARTGEGLEELKNQIAILLYRDLIQIERIYPYTEAGKTALIRRHGHILREEYTEQGISITALVPPDIYGRV